MVSSGNNGKEKNINNYADTMISKINACIENALKKQVRIEAAMVDSINNNKTVNVYFPTNPEKKFTNIQNQSIYQDLKPGDGVEILLKDGSYNNCWIIAKHAGNKDQEDIVEKEVNESWRVIIQEVEVPSEESGEGESTGA